MRESGSTTGVHSFPNIEQWLGPWLDTRGRSANYRALVDELADSGTHFMELALLESHLQLVAELCPNFKDVILEKQRLPRDEHEANKTILNKLAEIRAIAGLYSLNFSNVRFLPQPGPDLSAAFDQRTYVIEVTRLGSSMGKRAQVWDSYHDLRGGSSIGVLSLHGAAPDAISEAVYREIEGKSRQLKSANAEHGIVWISLGRDYLTAGRYELAGVGALRNLRRTMQSSVERAMDSIAATGLYNHVRHIVLSPGRDFEEVVFPPLEMLNGPKSD